MHFEVGDSLSHLSFVIYSEKGPKPSDRGHRGL